MSELYQKELLLSESHLPVQTYTYQNPVGDAL